MDRGGRIHRQATARRNPACWRPDGGERCWRRTRYVGGDDAAEVEFFAVAEQTQTSLTVEDYRLVADPTPSSRSAAATGVVLTCRPRVRPNADMDASLCMNLLQRAGRFEQAAAVLAALPTPRRQPTGASARGRSRPGSRAGRRGALDPSPAPTCSPSDRRREAGDVMTQRNTLDQIIEDDSVPVRVRMLALSSGVARGEPRRFRRGPTLRPSSSRSSPATRSDC